MKSESLGLGAMLVLLPDRALNGGALGCDRSAPSGTTMLLEKHGSHNQPKQPEGRARREAVMVYVLEVEKT